MDTHTNPQPQGNRPDTSSGCCGGKAEAQPQDNVAQRDVLADDARPAGSGCRCGQN